ncbi:MAG: cob(I)yrinic acid a,c-diamide adenosyltransferase [Chloroflexota bacterium]|nr:cob(I)yrinic acid a,c-diamide adenosyltransferase [Chloroflexota bacterium]
MQLYTGRGDQGTTDLLGERVGKDDPRIAALGALDEATSAIGLGRAHATSDETKEMLVVAQRDLYQVMAEIAFTDRLRPAAYTLGEDRVLWLEAATDAITARIELAREFILPGDSIPGAALDLARSVSRRAERDAVALANHEHLHNPQVLRYLNRLSSLLFVLARFEDRNAGATPLAAKARNDE